jgi:hypothetical protein
MEVIKICQMEHSRFQSGFVRSLPAYFEMALEAHHFYAESLPKKGEPVRAVPWNE